MKRDNKIEYYQFPIKLRHNMKDYEYHHILTKTGFPNHPYAILRKKEDRTFWYCPNQRSTYELVSYLAWATSSSDTWLDTVYQTAKADPTSYGTYAGLNNWSPTYTDEQLLAFTALCASVPNQG